MPTPARPNQRHRSRKAAVTVFGGIALVAGGLIGWYAHHNLSYDRGMARRIAAAGFTERQATTPDGHVINYGEGPDGGPPLLLVHGQMVSWEDYAPVLGDLSQHYHVFAVDCYGHGGSSKDPGLYTGRAGGADLAWFIEQVIGQPAVVSGHSSGGLIATWIAANAPQDVRGLVIEDAPFFATEAGRREHTYSWLDGFRTIHEFLGQTAEADYTAFYLQRSYLATFWGDGWQPMVVRPALDQLRANPGSIPRLWYLPPDMNRAFDLTACLQSGTGDYDLRFGDAFYDGSWFDGFDQAETLARVEAPSVLLHTAAPPNTSPPYYDTNGVLLAAMDAEDARRAHDLLPDDVLVAGIASGHNIHTERPDLFVQVLVDVLDRV